MIHHECTNSAVGDRVPGPQPRLALRGVGQGPRGAAARKDRNSDSGPTGGDCRKAARRPGRLPAEVTRPGGKASYRSRHIRAHTTISPRSRTERRRTQRTMTANAAQTGLDRRPILASPTVEKERMSLLRGKQASPTR